MRQFIPNFALVSLLSVLILQTNGRPTSCIPAPDGQGIKDRPIDFTRTCTADFTKPIEGLAIERRAGGGRPGGGDKTPGGPGRPGDRVPGNPDGPNEGGAPDSTGNGGMGRPGGSTGGMGDRPEQPAPGGQEFPPSTRNNQNLAATEPGKTFDPASKSLPEIDVNQVTNEMREQIRNKGIEGGPWYFFSGFQDRTTATGTIRDILSQKLGLGDRKIPSMQDAKKRMEEDPNALQYENSEEFGEYFWGAYSKAYARAVSGKVYVVIPEDMPLNQPYKNKGSNWWSFEASELTRNPNIEEIRIVRQDPVMNMGEPLYDLNGDDLIWKRGDEPLSYLGDEHNRVTRPTEAYNLP